MASIPTVATTKWHEFLHNRIALEEGSWPQVMAGEMFSKMNALNALDEKEAKMTTRQNG